MSLYELKCLAKPKSSYWIIYQSISSRRANVSSRTSFAATEIYPRRSHPLPFSIPLLHTFSWQMVPLSHTSFFNWQMVPLSHTSFFNWQMVSLSHTSFFNWQMVSLSHTSFFNWQMVPLSQTSLDKMQCFKIWMNHQSRTFSRLSHSHKMQTRIHKYSYSATGNEPWTGLQPSPNLWNNFVATSKQGCEKQQKSLLMKVSGWILKAPPNFQQIVSVEEYFL